MTIDENQTPVATTEAPEPQATQPEAPVAEASDPTPVADATVAPTNDQPAETPSTEPDPEPATLPGSEPSEPEQPVQPADPTPQAPTPEPVTPAEPTTPVAPPAQPQAGAVVAEASTPATDAPAVERDEKADADLFESYMNSFDGGGDATTEAPDMGYKRLSKGERLEATIIQVDRDKVFVDLGTKAEGIVPLGELSDQNLDTAKGHFNVGDKINVVVIRPEGAEGNPIVSKKRADFEEAWDRIEDAYQSGEMITAQVVDRVKGGLVVDVGVRGFVPATHVGSGKLRNIEKFVGQPLQLKVIEIDRERKKVVLSNRDAEEKRRQEAKDSIFQNVKPGETLEGTVRRLTDYGAFVDLGGVDGLLHISEMSWARINHPKEMFKEGQKIKVMVLRLDPNVGKISLGHRQVLPDPWKLIGENYTINQKLNVNISRIVQSGAFIRLPEGAEAFMPVSEMSFRRIKRPQDVVEENQEVEAQIIDLRPEERRMVLSMRAVGGGGDVRQGGGSYAPSTGGGYDDEWRRGGKDAKGKKGGKKGRGDRQEFEDFEESVGRRGFGTGTGATIGERLGALKGFLRPDEDDEETTGSESAETVETAEATE